MYYFPMDFEKLTRDGLIDTGDLTSAISEEDLNKIKLLSNEAIKDTGSAPIFQIMAANGQLERPIGTVLLHFEVADFQFQENFIVMKVLPNPLFGLCFYKDTMPCLTFDKGLLLSLTCRCNYVQTTQQIPEEQHPSNGNFIHPTTQRNPRNLQQNATPNRSQCHRYCHSVVTYGRSRKYFHYIFPENS